MKSNNLIGWLKNWKPTLLEAVILADVIVSGVTTAIGAYLFVNRSSIFASVFTLGVQGGMYAVGHFACPVPKDRRHRRTVWLAVAWVLLACFSVYFSALGMYELQYRSLRADQARTSILSQWKHATDEIGLFKTNAMTEVTQRKQTTTVDLNLERARARQARLERRPYFTEPLQRVTYQLAALNNAEAKLRDVKPLSVVPPEDSDQARLSLDQAFDSVKDAYAVLPDAVRTRLVEPRPADGTEVSEEIQTAFWSQLTARSSAVIVMVFLALVLDLLPLLLRFAATPRRTLSERILDLRHWAKEISHARRVPLASETETVQVTVHGVPQLDVRIAIPTAHGGPLVNIDRDFAQVTTEVRRERGCDVQLESVITMSGRPLLDDLPLLRQLGDEREVILKYIPTADSYADSSSEEVN